MFTASNGMSVDGHGYVHGYRGSDTTRAHAARIEFYGQLRDKELGRWRDPVLPDFVVYKKSNDCILVVDERGGVFTTVIWGYEVWDSKYSEVAMRYFEAHPERKPWHDAKPGEAWLLSLDDGRDSVQVVDTYGEFSPWGVDVASDENGADTIIAGRRIWPEPTDVVG